MNPPIIKSCYLARTSIILVWIVDPKTPKIKHVDKKNEPYARENDLHEIHFVPVKE